MAPLGGANNSRRSILVGKIPHQSHGLEVISYSWLLTCSLPLLPGCHEVRSPFCHMLLPLCYSASTQIQSNGTSLSWTETSQTMSPNKSFPKSFFFASGILLQWRKANPIILDICHHDKLTKMSLCFPTWPYLDTESLPMKLDVAIPKQDGL